MTPWLEGALARAETVRDWLAPLRSESLQTLKQRRWPDRKTEAWKYTSVRPLERKQFASEGQGADIQAQKIANLDSIDLLLVDGQLVSAIPQNLPQGLRILPLAEVSEADQQWAAGLFGQIKPQQHLFGLVNDALATGGVLIDVAPGAEISTPIRILSQQTQGQESHIRVLMRLGEGGKASVIEHSSGDADSFATQVAEYHLAPSAKLEHYRFALQTDAAMQVSGCHFGLHENAKLNTQVVGFGSQLSRVDVDIRHLGEHARADMGAIYLLKEQETFDLHSTIEHEVPNCVTDEVVRGIVGDHGKATFNGRIHIHRDAQKTLAELNNKNLLLARTAQINTKPELEIYADDVKCAHGATVAEVDKKALYYLRSRGVSAQQALIMLNFGFVNALVDAMPNSAVGEWLRPQLRQRFEAMQVS